MRHVRKIRKEHHNNCVENITAQRKRLGISQKDLAARLGITVDAMVRMKKGRIAPKMSRLQYIADNLQCSVAFLFTRETDIPDEFAKQISDVLKPLPPLRRGRARGFA